MLSFWTMFVSTAVLTASFFVPLGAPQAGWTAYPTLSTAIGTPGLGQTLWTVAIFFNGASSIMGAVNYITTVIRLRAPGMGYFQMPLTVWGFWLTSILNALFVPVLAAGHGAAVLRPRASAPSSSSPARRSRAAAIRSCTSTCSGSSATPRSTS